MQNIRGKQKSIRGRNKDSHVQPFSKSNPQNYQNNLDLGIFKREETSYFFSRYILGNEAEFFLNESSRHLGLIKAISPQAEFGVIYNRVKQGESKDSSEAISDEAKLISFKDVRKIIIRDVNSNECLKANFTDSDIARQSNKHIEQKELVPFFPSDQGLEDESLDMCNETFSPQEMYQINKDNFNVVSSYDPELSQYTVPVDKSDPNYPKLEEICERLAKDFVNDTDEINYANVEDEEVFSAVVRTNSNERQTNSKQDRKPLGSNSASNSHENKKFQKNTNSNFKNSQNKNSLSFIDNSVKSALKVASNSPSKHSPQFVPEKVENQSSFSSINDSKNDNSDKTVTGSDKKSEDSGDNKTFELDLDAPPFEPTNLEANYVSLSMTSPYCSSPFYMNNSINLATSQPLLPPGVQPVIRMHNYQMPGNPLNYMMNIGPPPSVANPHSSQRMGFYQPGKHNNNLANNGSTGAGPNTANGNMMSSQINNSAGNSGMQLINRQRSLDQIPQSAPPQTQQQGAMPQFCFFPMAGNTNQMVLANIANPMTMIPNFDQNSAANPNNPHVMNGQFNQQQIQQIQQISLQSPNNQHMTAASQMMFNPLLYSNGAPNNRGGPIIGNIVDNPSMHPAAQGSNQPQVALQMITGNPSYVGPNGSLPGQMPQSHVFAQTNIPASSQQGHLHMPSNQPIILTSYNSQHNTSGASGFNPQPPPSLMHQQPNIVLQANPNHGQQPPPPQQSHAANSHTQYNSPQGQPGYQDKR